ncbi:hypothetical protein [Parabacteroides hominis]|uniref:Lipoprotein n=1 Tax=Parabacteroides hominis TaxID=2763057 RepID=A0ABR7DU31_9BACT|nr:hypothetical protein [Parabacteroides hominis]MBC5634911.1 hypothetical protein [Parabacteroides hominis]
MKRIYLFAGAILTGMLSFSCQNDENYADKPLLQNLSYTECAKGLKSVFDNEYAECSFIDAHTMHVTLYNANINCGVTNIKGIANLDENNVISITLQTTGESANCICDRNISFDINKLTTGVEYTIQIKELSISFKVSFKEDMGITKVNNIINEN